MKTDDFDYYLPEELIAQTPLEKRDNSRLLILDKETGTICHKHFADIIDYLEEGDALVINDTKVIPARLIGAKEETGAVIEILLLHNISDNIWECLAKPQKRLHKDTIITFGNGELKCKVIDILEDGITHVEMLYEGIFLEVLESLGSMPLPPYIHEKLDNPSRYQTVYALNPGSAAAPTAGLHFTKELLKQIEDKGIHIVHVTLHVGLGTFRPVQVEDVKKHKMHTERYYMSRDAARTLTKVKEAGHKIIAVGTTSTRTLETVMQKYGCFKECSGDTNIFIYPGFEFKAIDAQITNFHLPKSTLIMLISAFAGKENVMHAYSEAVKEQYRFFSFGDSMFIK